MFGEMTEGMEGAGGGLLTDGNSSLLILVVPGSKTFSPGSFFKWTIVDDLDNRDELRGLDDESLPTISLVNCDFGDKEWGRVTVVSDILLDRGNLFCVVGPIRGELGADVRGEFGLDLHAVTASTRSFRGNTVDTGDFAIHSLLNSESSWSCSCNDTRALSSASTTLIFR